MLAKGSRKSQGSSSRGHSTTSVEIQSMLKAFVDDTDKHVYYGNESKASEEFSGFSARALPVITEDDLLKLAGGGRVETGLVLTGTNEKELQAFLSSNISALHAVDTHDIGSKVEFLNPRAFDDGKIGYTNTGKADLTSCKRRMVFEVKSKKQDDLLAFQMLERLVTSMDISHITKRCIIFGATPDLGLVFIGVRHVPTSRQAPHRVSVHLFSVSIKEIIKMWLMASEVQGPSDFLTEDAPLVLNSLHEAGLDPWLCRIRLLEWSQHNVYAVTSPKKYFFDKKESLGVCCDAPEFAIKVVKDDKAFKREHDVLKATKQFYFLGASCKSGGISMSPKGLSGVCCEDYRAQSGWGHWSRDVTATTGGVIFMLLGESLPEDLDGGLRIRVINDCIPQLRIIHGMGYVHTDLRLPNILAFSGKYAPIDYGEAVKIGSDVNLTEFSERRKVCVMLSPDVSSIKWGAERDIEMLFRAVYSCPAEAGENNVVGAIGGCQAPESARSSPPAKPIVSTRCTNKRNRNIITRSAATAPVSEDTPSSAEVPPAPVTAQQSGLRKRPRKK